jgi:hypothetical protein
MITPMTTAAASVASAILIQLYGRAPSTSPVWPLIRI